MSEQDELMTPGARIDMLRAKVRELELKIGEYQAAVRKCDGCCACLTFSNRWKALDRGVAGPKCDEHDKDSTICECAEKSVCDCGEPCHCGKVRNHYCNHKVVEKPKAKPECDCFVPAMDGAGQHSPSCAIFKK